MGAGPASRLETGADAALAGSDPQGDLVLTANGPGDWANRLRVWIVGNPTAVAGDGRHTFRLVVAYYAEDAHLPENQAQPPGDLAAALRTAAQVEEFPQVTNDRNSLDFAPALLRAESNLVTGSLQTEPPGAIAPTGEGAGNAVAGSR